MTVGTFLGCLVLFYQILLLAHADVLLVTLQSLKVYCLIRGNDVSNHNIKNLFIRLLYFFVDEAGDIVGGDDAICCEWQLLHYSHYP